MTSAARERADLRIRRSRPADDARLREIAAASKGHWGYNRERVTAWASELDLSGDVWIAVDGGRAVAWLKLVGPDAGDCELHDLWVDARAIGRGLGTVLFDFARERAARLGARTLHWEAEPNAVGFYARQGAETVGEATSSWGRTLPVMRIDL